MSKLTAKQFVEQLVFKSKGYIKKYNTLEYAAENNGIEELPIGHIIPYMGLTAPRHYLICDGAEYSTAEYPELFEHLLAFPQTTRAQWGNADWSTKFNVPKLQGEFLRGSGTNGFANQGNGAAVGVHQDGTGSPIMNGGGSHLGIRVKNSSNGEIYSMFEKVDSAYGDGYYRYITGTNTAEAYNPATYTSRPTNTSVLFCIRYEPSYNIKVEGKDIYSTEERVIGRWIDGKAIYRKTTQIAALPNNDIFNYPHGIENIKEIVGHDGVINLANTGRVVGFPWFSSNDLSILAAITDVGLTHIQIKALGDRSNCSAIVTLYYTKTT